MSNLNHISIYIWKKDVSKCIQTVQETNNIAITRPTLRNEKSA